MFTGIIAHCGTIESVEEIPSGKRLLIKTQFDSLDTGESIAVDGVCLTVTDHQANNFYCDLSPETLAKTTAASYQIGAKLNLERAMKAADPMGGHFVSGHVEDVAELVSLEKNDDFWSCRFEPRDKAGLKQVISKGSITLNGVSLTVNSVDQEGFEVMLIPHTLEVTNLKYLEVGHHVNIEYDMLMKYLAKQVKVVDANE